MKIDLVKLVEKVSEEEKIEGGIHKIFALTCLQKLVDMQNEAINYTHSCESDSEQLGLERKAYYAGWTHGNLDIGGNFEKWKESKT